ncbi:MAG: CRISPR-associated protein Csn1 [Prevotellaceae bacterium]|nr:CRISPR-associated protein Csn1 [Prevotellaceae bacterium]
MARILGIDTGTNSLGWAIVEKTDDSYNLIDKGVNIFSEGVKIEKGIESSKAADRTEHRSVRKHYWRRKVRKIRLLTLLIENHLCPPLDKESLRDWRLKKIYPNDELFMDWQRTDDKRDVNPYKFRYICLTHKLDMSDITQRYILGRALYHLNQRRGFLSNRKETTKASEGEVLGSINELSKEIEDAGYTYLGEYFYHLYQEGNKIRKHYTARKEHYLKEFRAICAKQELDGELVKKLEKAIFDQRPLKSQKGQVGMCTFEKGKARCLSSHPLYEDFRMYSFLNNIKIQTPRDTELRYLTGEEKDAIIPLFKPKSKRTFNFEDIAKKLAAGKKKYCYFKDEADKPYKFNYQMDTQVAGSVVNAQLEEIFGKKWLDAVCEVYTLAEGKTRFQIMNDIWHALFFYDDEDKLKKFAKNRLQLDDEKAEKFSKINMPNDYAALSLKAIRKILPYMRDYGLIYSQAVFLANLSEVLPHHIWGIKEMREVAIENIIAIMSSYDKNREVRTQEQCIKDFLIERYNVSVEGVKKLYHPSMMELYPRVRPDDDGIFQLGSPRISSVKNPMAMRSLFRLRKVINLLLKEGKIDADTTIHIEFARELNDANRRKAIQEWNREQKNNRELCKKEIIKLGIANPSDTDILKYQLWEEQKHRCLYTGESIGIADFLGENPKYDIEHTIPRSVGGDSTKTNLTLCNSKYNRDVKKTKLPVELTNHEEILERIREWKEKYDELDKRIRKINTKGAASKEDKDRKIKDRHKLSLERDYWRGKYQRFVMETVPEGFSRRQNTDASVIARYARLYLKSVFKHVYIVKGLATSDFRKMWGIQEEYTKKERVNHVHHCIDAITIACIGKNEYDKLAQFYHDEDSYKWNRGNKPQFEKPWPTFVSDIKQIQDELLIAHYSKDNMPKQARRYVRDSKGGKVLTQGDTARASLHNDTYYGAIKKDGKTRYVVRKGLDGLDEKDVKNIVDDEVRSKVENAISLHGSLKKALEETIWMNEEKKIPIKKVRIYANSVTRPINIRQQRDVSRHEHKRQYHVQNDRNYMMAIYVWRNGKGKEKREFELVNNLAAADFYRRSNDNVPTDNQLVPLYSQSGYELRYKLKIGTMVLLYENTPEEVWDLDRKDLQKRLYKVTGLSSYILQQKYSFGTIELVYHQDARPSSEIKKINGEFGTNEEFRAGIKMLHTQFTALVQGVDFEINDLGEIKRLI